MVAYSLFDAFECWFRLVGSSCSAMDAPVCVCYLTTTGIEEAEKVERGEAILRMAHSLFDALECCSRLLGKKIIILVLLWMPQRVFTIQQR